MIRYLCWLVGFIVLSPCAKTQTLAETLAARRASIFDSTKDSLDQEVRQQVGEQLLQRCRDNGPSAADHVFYQPDSLAFEEGKTQAYTFMNELVYLRSADSMVQIVSWDDLGGGSYHTYTGWIQVRTQVGCNIQTLAQITGEDEVSISAIYDLPGENSDKYLLFGYGTYGSGKQHAGFWIVERTENGLVNCADCIPLGVEHVIYCNRTQEIQLQYDPVTTTLSYRKYALDEMTGFYRRAYKTVSWNVTNGKLLR